MKPTAATALSRANGTGAIGRSRSPQRTVFTTWRTSRMATYGAR